MELQLNLCPGHKIWFNNKIIRLCCSHGNSLLLSLPWADCLNVWKTRLGWWRGWNNCLSRHVQVTTCPSLLEWTHTSTEIKECSPQTTNQRRKSVSLTCCSAVMLQRGRVITEGEIGSPCLFFNCLAAFNRTHLSLQHVEIPNTLNVLNTSHSTASINYSNLPVLQPRTCPARLLWHTPRIIFSTSSPAFRLRPFRRKGAKFEQSAPTGKSQAHEILCYSCHHTATNLSHTAANLFGFL